MIATDRLTTDTPWRNGRLDGRRAGAMLLFGRMFEDPRVEVAALAQMPALDSHPHPRPRPRPRRRVFCIASAGCIALALARAGHSVTAVDINPVQVGYVRQRAMGMEAHDGLVDRLMAMGRRGLALVGIRPALLREFLAMDDPIRQVRFWRERIDGPALRRVLGAAASPLLLRLVYGPAFIRGVPGGFGRLLADRLARGWANHANRGNPYAWRMWLGEAGPEVGDGLGAGMGGTRPGWSAPSLAPGTRSTARPLPGAEGEGKIALACAEAAAFLERCPPGSFDAFSLSNILDAAPAGYEGRLMAAVAQAGTPGAVMVLRSFAPAGTTEESRWAAYDRAMLWGSIRVTPTDAIATRPAPPAPMQWQDFKASDDLFAGDGWRR